MITIDEEDLQEFGQWPFSDKLLAQLLNKVKAQEPRVIGLNLFRNLPVETGKSELEEIYRTTPNLIGAKRTVGIEIAPPKILEESGQVGFSDVIADPDGTIRRALVSINIQGTDLAENSLSTQLALTFLEKDGILPEEVQKSRWWSLFDKRKYFRLGKSVFAQLSRNDGGYVRVDHGGFQLLLNYRIDPYNFDMISMRNFMEGNIPPRLVRDVNQPILKDRLVLIGVVSDSSGARLYTPFSKNKSEDNKGSTMPGVFVHAHATSQLVRAAKDGRPLLRVWPQEAEWFWLFGWAIAGAGIRWYLLNIETLNRRVLTQNACLGGVLAAGAIALVGFGYSSFLIGFWVPMVSAYAAFFLAAMVMGSYHNHELQKLATLDGLTQIANRRYFEEYLYKIWWKCEREKRPISLIMCDIDHFKLYNDHYGHQLGDRCLQQVVASIQQTLRTSDLMARYGGEEFVIILPKTDKGGACHVANRICQTVAELQLKHDKSPTSPHITVSCGVSSVEAHSQLSPVELIASADKALYVAKAEGRNRTSFRPYQNLPPLV
ncbi:MAG: diguanylate cyclase [Limnothrix sp. RL_2_0]|nr:diguanylate cyclase [Limnothrix sp. RL_2_0]